MNTLAFDDFRRHCLPYLKPELLEGSYLFSFHRTVPQQDRISLEGLIIRLNPAKSAKTTIPPLDRDIVPNQSRSKQHSFLKKI
jgi:hypothetical protein